MNNKDNRITGRSILLGAIFAAAFACLTMFLDNRRTMQPTANQIPLFPYILLLVMVLLVNPLLRLLRVFRRLSAAEMLIIFIMTMVSSGMSTYGLAQQFLPLAGSLFNRHWNTEQTEWKRYVEPFLNENYFVSEPGIRQAAWEYRDALLRLQEMRGQAPGADLSEQERLVEEKKAAHEELERRAFEKVDLFRRGLPKNLNSFPGFIPIIGEDDAASYFGRIRRLVCGKRAVVPLREALRAASGRGAGVNLDDGAAALIAALAGRAADLLAPAANIEAIQDEVKGIEAQDAALVAAFVELERSIAENSEKKGKLRADEAEGLQSEIDRATSRHASIRAEQARLNVVRERILARLGIVSKTRETLDGLRAIQADLGSAARPPAADVSARLSAALAAFPEFDASLRRYFIGDLPWSHWARPLLNWMVLIVLTYIILMTFNILIFRQWAYNEKLIYPLAQLPELLTDSGDDKHWIPEVYRTGFFWCGFLVSGGILGWNLLCKSGLVQGLTQISLDNAWDPYINGTALSGIVGAAKSAIFFTLVGVSFLIPKKISFSLWFFTLFAMLQQLVVVWLGYGQNEYSFPAEFWITMNFRTAEGGGALMVFASVVFFKCRKYLLCALWPGSVADLDVAEQKELRFSSVLFMAASLGLVLCLWRGMRVNLGYAIFGYIIMMIITTGLVRAVTEGGILGYKAYFGPFHIIRHLFGFDKAWTATHLMAPFLVYYSVFFLDIKTFIGPAMANSIKIRDDYRMDRGRFYLVIFLCMAIAAAAAILSAIMMAYSSGADAMSTWFYTGLPRALFERIASMSRTPPLATDMERGWFIGGGALMAALLYFRQFVFWLPHPIGLIMLINPVMKTFWFSIFLGWIAKAAVSRYGNKDVYSKFRSGFVGLIVGELFIVLLAMIVSIVVGRNLGIDLNRN